MIGSNAQNAAFVAESVCHERRGLVIFSQSKRITIHTINLIGQKIPGFEEEQTLVEECIRIPHERRGRSYKANVHLQVPLTTIMIVNTDSQVMIPRNVDFQNGECFRKQELANDCRRPLCKECTCHDAVSLSSKHFLSLLSTI